MSSRPPVRPRAWSEVPADLRRYVLAHLAIEADDEEDTAANAPSWAASGPPWNEESRQATHRSMALAYRLAARALVKR